MKLSQKKTPPQGESIPTLGGSPRWFREAPLEISLEPRLGPTTFRPKSVRSEEGLSDGRAVRKERPFKKQGSEERTRRFSIESGQKLKVGERAGGGRWVAGKQSRKTDASSRNTRGHRMMPSWGGGWDLASGWGETGAPPDWTSKGRLSRWGSGHVF